MGNIKPGTHLKTEAKSILLITPAAPDQTPFSTTEKRPPLGVGYLISVLRRAGHKVFFIDNYLQPNNFLDTNILQENSIDFVGLYANTICLRDTSGSFTNSNSSGIRGNGTERSSSGVPIPLSPSRPYSTSSISSSREKVKMRDY